MRTSKFAGLATPLFVATVLALAACDPATGGSAEKADYSTLRVEFLEVTADIQGAVQYDCMPVDDNLLISLKQEHPDKYTPFEGMHIEVRQVSGWTSVLLCDQKDGKLIFEDASWTSALDRPPVGQEGMLPCAFTLSPATVALANCQ